MIDNEAIIYRLLVEVFSSGAYSGIVLDEALQELDADSRAYITRVFYGVIEKSLQFDYIIHMLCDKKPKNNVVIIIKIGLFLMRYSDTPSYAAINKTVELCKRVGKSGVSGFVNALLRKSSQIDLSKINYKTEAERLSVLYSYPIWFVNLLTAEYGTEQAEAFLGYSKRQSTHIRHNIARTSKQAFEDKLFALADKMQASIKSTALGYYVDARILRALQRESFTAQSFASMVAVHCYLNNREQRELNIKRVLDVCGAPGGKSIYLKQLFSELQITCCDIHPHRVKLIEDYSRRMGTSIAVMQNDATVSRSDWVEEFDMVICDVPCSGLGLVGSKPDIILNRREDDIKTLAKLQQKILSTSAKYLRSGGLLCYSTCTITNAENWEIINSFLKANADFELVPIVSEVRSSSGAIQLLPQRDDCDGFFVAKLKRK